MKAVFTDMGGAESAIEVGAVITAAGTFFDGAEIVSAYTRKDALEDGQQYDIAAFVDPTKYGFKPGWRIFVTSAVKVAVIDSQRKGWAVADDSTRVMLNQVNAGLLLRDLMAEMQRQRGRISDFMTTIHTTGAGECLELISRCGPVDIDDPSPCITLMTPEDN